MLAGDGRCDGAVSGLGQTLEDAAPDEGSGSDDVNTSGVHVGQQGTLFAAHFQQARGGLADGLQVQAGTVDQCGIVLAQAQGVRRDGGDGSGNADDGGGP